MSLLLIDDDVEYAAFLENAFSPHAAIVFTHATSVAASRPLLARRAIDVVLLSLTNEGDGDEGLAELRRDRESPPIVALTDRWTDEAVARALEAGAHDILVKSDSDPGMLARTVRYAIERDRFREHLKQAGQRFRSLIENALDMISVVGADGVIVYESPSVERILGWQPHDLVGRPFIDYVHPDDAAMITGLFEDLFARNDVVESIEFRLRGSSGWHSVEATARPLAGASKREAVIHARDVTERKRSETILRAREAELRQAQKMEAVGRLAGGIAHDFNNMLTIIIGASERLVEALEADASLRRDAETVRQTAQRAGALTRQMLAFSRQQISSPTVLDLNALIAEANGLLHRLIGETIDVSVLPARDLGAVRADRNQIEQVLFNLAVNARDAMPEGGRLTIETRNIEVEQSAEDVALAAGSYVAVSVTDTGVGMDAATCQRAFDPFFTTKEIGKGTGLGLSTVYGIVTQNGGAITIASEPRCGTSVTFYLPRVPDAVQPAVGAAVTAAPPKGGNETVLLVEDEDGVRELIRDILATAGYRVLDASRPTTAMQLAKQFENQIHLMLTDIVMPDMNGRDLAARLLVERPTMQILYMSGYPEHAAMPGGALEPGMEFISKPFERRALLWRIRDLLDASPTPR